MNIQWNTVTWYSKLGALLFFIIVFPMIAFGIGREYQKTVQFLEYATPKSQLNPTDTSYKKDYSGIRGTTTPQSLITISDKNGKYTETVSNTDGSFFLFLSPGIYTVRTTSAEIEIEVRAGSMSRIVLTQK